MNTPKLETERLLLRKFQREDMNALFKIYHDKEVNNYLPWFTVQSLEETAKLFEKNYERIYQQKQGYQYAICLKSDNVPIGYVHVSMEESHDLGYGLQKEFWNQGIVTEACQAVIAQIKKDGFSYVTATHDRNNIGSGKVMRKLGMQYCYSYEEQWQPKDIKVTFRLYQINFCKPKNWIYQKYWNESQVHFVEQDEKGELL